MEQAGWTLQDHKAILWEKQVTAIHHLETSLAEAHPRALIQMVMGSGKTFTACNIAYRLAKFAGAKRQLFLVDPSTTV